MNPRTKKRLVCLLALLALFGQACRGTNQSQAPSDARDNVARTPASPSPQIRTEIGFASRQKFLDHYEKHGREFGEMNKEEYLRRAQMLRDAPVGGNILEVRRRDGVITRFDRDTGAFLAFNADLTIRTFFKPNDGERYFRRQSKR